MKKLALIILSSLLFNAYAAEPTKNEQPTVKKNPLFEKKEKMLESQNKTLSSQDNTLLQKYQELSSKFTINEDYFIFKKRIGSLTSTGKNTITMFFQYNSPQSYELYKYLKQNAERRGLTLWLIPIAYGDNISHARIYYGLGQSVPSEAKWNDVNERLMFDTSYAKLNPTDLKQLREWLSGQGVSYEAFSNGYGSPIAKTQSVTVLNNLNSKAWFINASPSFYVNGKYYFTNITDYSKVSDMISLGLLGDRLSME